MQFFRVKDLAKYQFYKGKQPPWIKLYLTAVSSYAFSYLSDASKAHLMQIWVHANHNNNKLPFDAKWIQTRLSATEDVDLDGFVEGGFIEIIDEERKI